MKNFELKDGIIRELYIDKVCRKTYIFKLIFDKQVWVIVIHIGYGNPKFTDYDIDSKFIDDMNRYFKDTSSITKGNTIRRYVDNIMYRILYNITYIGPLFNVLDESCEIENTIYYGLYQKNYAEFKDEFDDGTTIHIFVKE